VALGVLIKKNCPTMNPTRGNKKSASGAGSDAERGTAPYLLPRFPSLQVFERRPASLAFMTPSTSYAGDEAIRGLPSSNLTPPMTFGNSYDLFRSGSAKFFEAAIVSVNTTSRR
jgi:hypothetical protein